MTKLKMSAPKTENMKPASHSGLREISFEAGGDHEMWVSRVVRFSSQYNSKGWSANDIIGSPKVFPQYGDIRGAWAQGKCDANQFIEVEFPRAVYVQKVDIYETLNAGAVTRITAVSASGQKVNIWQRNGGPQVITESRIFSPELQSPDFPTRCLELSLDCTRAGTWCELDAIRLTGRQSKYKHGLREISAEAGGDLEMWVSRVVRFSSQYNSQGWSANDIIGSPKVFPQYGDIRGAWAQRKCDANQFIEVEFPTAVYVDKVDIYETFNAGAVTRIMAVSAGGQKVKIWQRHSGPQVITESRIFSPELESPDFPTRCLELSLDCTRAGTWCELDAIRLTGRQSKYMYRLREISAEASGDIEMWVSRVVHFSSQYNSKGWSADDIIGPPQVYPRYGDIKGAWAQGKCDANQFIEVEFPTAVYVDKVDIYETLNAGAVTRITAVSASGQKVNIWHGGPQVITQSRIFSPELQSPDFPTRRLELFLDCTQAGTWCELDAIRLTGKQSKYAPPTSLKQLSEEFFTLTNNPEFSDVSFSVDGHVIHGHRAILSARSHYFQAKFSSGMQESKPNKGPIQIQGIGREAFLGLLHFLYTNSVGKDVSVYSLLEQIRAPPTSLKQLSEELFSLINNEEFSDVSFSIDGHVIHGHRAILSARSHYFQAMFSSGMQESKASKGPILQIQGIGKEAFLGLLGYLYTNSVGKDVSVYSLLELIRVGEMFATRELSQLCFWFVSQELTVDNVLPLYRSAVEELPPLVDCQRLCLDFIAAHMDKISVLPAFTSLPQALMVDIIQHSVAKVSLSSK